jgi:hypothetical protein
VGQVGRARHAGLAWVLASTLACSLAGPRSREPGFFLWVWETATDVTKIDPARAGVAFLAGSLFIGGDTVGSRPRLQPLDVAPGTLLVAVVRIEISPAAQPTYSAAERSSAVEAVLRLARLDGVGGVAAASRPRAIDGLQVDFDAPVSARAFYAGLLRDLRARLDPAVTLSMTALASWCLGDGWIAGLPVDEAVPMLFRMGPDKRYIEGLLAQGKDFALPECRWSIGLSVDELTVRPAARRVYLFNPQGWTNESAARALAEYSK